MNTDENSWKMSPSSEPLCTPSGMTLIPEFRRQQNLSLSPMLFFSLPSHKLEIGGWLALMSRWWKNIHLCKHRQGRIVIAIDRHSPPDTRQAHPLNDHFTAREQKTLPEKGLSDEQSRNALRESLMDLKDILFLPNLES